MIRKSKVVFLDRDGVINRFPGYGKYVTNWRSFKFIPGSLLAIKRLTQGGFVIFVISNQAGVAKGFYSRETLQDITSRMLKRIRLSGGKVNKVLYCRHLPEDNCPCRKPKTAMITRALKTLPAGIDRAHSYLIGDDTLHDITMGKRARLRTILVLSGRERLQGRPSWTLRPNYVFKNLLEASRFILKSKV